MNATSRNSLRELTAAELRATLARRQMSAAALARHLGWPQRVMARRVSGEVALDMDDLETIAGALGIAVADLLPGEARTVAPVRNEVTRRYPQTTIRPRDTRPSGRTNDVAQHADTRRPAYVTRGTHTRSD